MNYLEMINRIKDVETSKLIAELLAFFEQEDSTWIEDMSDFCMEVIYDMTPAEVEKLGLFAVAKGIITDVEHQEIVKQLEEGRDKIKVAEVALQAAVAEAQRVAEEYGLPISCNAGEYFPEGHPGAPEYYDGCWVTSSHYC